MNVSIETMSGLERRLTIALPSEEFESQITERLEDARGKVRIVEAYVGDLMDRLGYPREYKGIATPGMFSNLRPQLTEPLERFINGDMRPQYNLGNSRLKKQLDANVAPLCPPLWDD